MIKGLILSLQFLTRVPINFPVEFNHRNIRMSIFFFPLVGAFIGLVGGVVYYFISPLNMEIASMFTLLSIIFLTGGLHIDGLSDTVDGFFSYRDREKTLEIMKDSRIGAFGVLGIVILLLSKYVLIKNTANLPISLILSLTNSRIVSGYIISYKRCARPGGLGELFHKSKPGLFILVNCSVYLFLLLYLNTKYLIPLVMTFLSGELISRLSYKKIDGLTGDVYGAIIEVGEVISLLGFWGITLWI